VAAGRRAMKAYLDAQPAPRGAAPRGVKAKGAKAAPRGAKGAKPAPTAADRIARRLLRRKP